MSVSGPSRLLETRRSTDRRGPLDATKTFALVVVVVAAGTLGLARAAGAPRVASVRPAAPAIRDGAARLTGRDAAARFRELDRLLRRAYFERDATLVPMFIHPESDLDETIVVEIGLLLRKRVLDRADIRTVSLRILSADAGRVVVRQRITERARFVTESGEDVTASRQPIWEVVDWTLRPDRSEWKIFSSKVVGGGALRGRS